MWKRKILLALLLTFPALLPGCSEEDLSAHFGRYECVAVAQGNAAIAGAGEYVELREEGVGVLSLTGLPMEGVWALSGDDFTLSVDRPEEELAYDLAGSLEDGTIVVDIEGYTCTFVKTG